MPHSTLSKKLDNIFRCGLPVVLLPAEVATGLSTVLDSRALVAGDRGGSLPEAVAAVVHPEHGLEDCGKRLLSQDDVAGPEVPGCDEVATPLGGELQVDPAGGGRQSGVVPETQLGHLNLWSDAAGGGEVGD